MTKGLFKPSIIPEYKGLLIMLPMEEEYGRDADNNGQVDEQNNDSTEIIESSRESTEDEEVRRQFQGHHERKPFATPGLIRTTLEDNLSGKAFRTEA